MAFAPVHWWCPNECQEKLKDGSSRTCRYSVNVAECLKCGEEQPIDSDAVQLEAMQKARPDLFSKGFGKGKAKGGKGNPSVYAQAADHWNTLKGKAKETARPKKEKEQERAKLQP